MGGFGLFLRTAEIARFGQFLLQQGFWNGKQLVPKAWIQAATSFQTGNGDDPMNDWAQGYGYQFWMCRHGFYRGDGAFGQFCIVMPGLDAVLAVTSGTLDMGKVMEVAWDKLVPALRPSALPADRSGREALARALAGRSVRSHLSTAKPAARLRGRTYLFPANPQKIDRLSLVPGRRGATVIVLQRHGKPWRIECGDGAWVKGEAPWWDDQARPLAASGGWTAPNAFTARFCRLDGAYVNTVRLVFSARTVRLSDEVTIAFPQGGMTELRGTMINGKC